MKYKVGDRVKVKSKFDFYEKYQGKQFVIEECDSSDDTYLCHPATGGCRIWISEENLEPVAIKSVLFPNVEYVLNEKQAEEYADGGKIAYAPNGAPLFWMPEPEKPVSIEEQLGLPKGVSIHDLPTNEWYNPIGERRFREQMEQAKKLVTDYMKGKRIEFKNGSFIIVKDEEENNLKFTFYVKEGTRVDKTCNKLIPTMTTFVTIGRYHSGKATCDKVDYDERQGCLEAIANAFLDGNFDREFNKAVKKNERTELHNRTCTYCGKVFDTVEELKVHEAWHVERKKARRERYLLRKRAKEIAFEEQAQKMAKEMIEEDK